MSVVAVPSMPLAGAISVRRSTPEPPLARTRRASPRPILHPRRRRLSGSAAERVKRTRPQRGHCQWPLVSRGWLNLRHTIEGSSGGATSTRPACRPGTHYNRLARFDSIFSQGLTNVVHENGRSLSSTPRSVVRHRTTYTATSVRLGGTK